MIQTKFCPDCGFFWPTNQFHKNARSKDGFAFYCKKHTNERNKASAQQGGFKKSKCSYPGCTEDHRAGGFCQRHYDMDYKQRNAKKIKDKNRAYYLSVTKQKREDARTDMEID